jgi:hypothetical protein
MDGHWCDVSASQSSGGQRALLSVERISTCIFSCMAQEGGTLMCVKPFRTVVGLDAGGGRRARMVWGGQQIQ